MNPMVPLPHRELLNRGVLYDSIFGTHHPPKKDSTNGSRSSTSTCLRLGFYVPLLDLKGICHYWAYVVVFLQGA